jgi:hypothetical protein
METARDLDELERPRDHRIDVEVYVTSLPANRVWRSNEVTGPASSLAAYPTPNYIDMQCTRDVVSAMSFPVKMNYSVGCTGCSKGFGTRRE